MTKPTSIKIANAGGFWGDDPSALERQIHGGPLDYVTIDFLAEITMSILQRQKQKNPDAGYAHDFVQMVDPVLDKIANGQVRLITNAGGINPIACAQAILKRAEIKSLKNLRIAVVHGDDIVPSMEALNAKGIDFKNMEDGCSFATVKDKILSANVYFGSHAVVEALKYDPHLIITGRVTDTGISMAPMIHHLGWKYNDYDKLAQGLVAGHLIECGAQVCGGNFSDWRKVNSYANIGYPIVEVFENGDFVIYKHKDTGGSVTVDTVREQLFYEMGDPSVYISPDIVADFSKLVLTQEGVDRVRVSGAKGRAPTPYYKVSMAYEDGKSCHGELLISGPDAIDKAELFTRIVREENNFSDEEFDVAYVGYNCTHRGLSTGQRGADVPEVLVRFFARHQDTGKLEKFLKKIPSLILRGPAGVCVTGGLNKIKSIASYWPCLIPKDSVAPIVEIHSAAGIEDSFSVKIPDQEFKEVSTYSTSDSASKVTATIDEAIAQLRGKETAIRPLKELCLTRSGDKGNTCNIGVLARDPNAYALLKDKLDSQIIKNLFQDFCQGKVVRFEVPHLLGLNFLLEETLDGGGLKARRMDPQGKTLSQALLLLSIDCKS